MQITLRKARNTANRHLQGKRDVRRDVQGYTAPADGFDEPTALLNQLDADDPTPAEAALLNEALEQRFQALREPELRLIAQKKLEGFTNQEIADELKCTLRTVEASWGGSGATGARPKSEGVPFRAIESGFRLPGRRTESTAEALETPPCVPPSQGGKDEKPPILPPFTRRDPEPFPPCEGGVGGVKSVAHALHLKNDLERESCPIVAMWPDSEGGSI